MRKEDRKMWEDVIAWAMARKLEKNLTIENFNKSEFGTIPAESLSQVLGGGWNMLLALVGEYNSPNADETDSLKILSSRVSQAQLGIQRKDIQANRRRAMAELVLFNRLKRWQVAAVTYITPVRVSQLIKLAEQEDPSLVYTSTRSRSKKTMKNVRWPELFTEYHRLHQSLGRKPEPADWDFEAIRLMDLNYYIGAWTLFEKLADTWKEYVDNLTDEEKMQTTMDTMGPTRASFKEYDTVIDPNLDTIDEDEDEDEDFEPIPEGFDNKANAMTIPGEE